jgi:hypothetical protein
VGVFLEVFVQKIEFDGQFLSYDEQFQLLKARGMNFSDEEINRLTP